MSYYNNQMPGGGSKQGPGYPTAPPAAPAYPTAASYPTQQVAPPPYTQQPMPPQAQPYGQPGYYPQAPPQRYPAQAQPYPGQYPPMQPPVTVVHQGGFDAGARFDVTGPSLPPPPPGCLPTASQMAAAQGQNVVVTQRKGDFVTGGSDGGMVIW